MARRDEHRYLLLDSANAALGQAVLESKLNENEFRVTVLEDDAEEVGRHEVIQLISVDSGELPLQCRVLRQREDKVVLEKIATLDPEVRRNLRVPVKFETFIYPVSRIWKWSRQRVQSLDLSCGGVAFYGDGSLEEGEWIEIVIPMTEEPLILHCEILRKKELRNDKFLYAVKFIDMCEDEEVTVREAVFSIQLDSRFTSRNGDGSKEVHS